MVTQQRLDGTRFEALARLADEAGADRVAADARALSERLRDGRFYVACVGQFKRGKSTLLNALVGESILPVGVVPVTAVVTVVRHGPELAARIRQASGEWQPIAPAELASFVTEEENPENRKQVTAVEVFAPSELLATGMCLVDTPGIGSVFADNTEATRAFVPHIDAALVVLGADPPISAGELALLSEIAGQCRHLLFVLNKADRMADGDLDEAERFTRQVLAERAHLDEVSLFAVSAADRLAGRGASRDWPRLTEALTELARQSGSSLVRAAEERGLALLGNRLRRRIEEERGALLRPIAESEQRVEELRGCVADADRSLNDLSYLFEAEQNRLAAIFAGRRDRFLAGAIPDARREFAAACRELPARRGARLRATSIDLAREVAGRHLDGWLADTEPEAEALYVAAMDRFAELSNRFLDQLRDSGDPALADLPASIRPEVGFRWDSRLFYKDLWHSTGQGGLTWVADLFRSRSQALRSIERSTGGFLQRLLEINATRIVNDLDERVLESRRRFQFEIRGLLEEVIESADRSLDRARDLHRQGSQAVAAELDRIGTLGERFRALRLDGLDGALAPASP